MNNRIPPLDTSNLTAQVLLDWYMQLCALGLMWNPDDDPATIVDTNRMNIYSVGECIQLRGVRQRIHKAFADPCQIAMHAIKCYDEGVSAVATPDLGAPKNQPLPTLLPIAEPRTVTLFYLRMYNEGTRRTQHWASTGPSLLAARQAVVTQIGDRWKLEGHQALLQTTELVCVFLN